jgi:hypothetical protein
MRYGKAGTALAPAAALLLFAGRDRSGGGILIGASTGNGTAGRRIPRASVRCGRIFLSAERGHP